MKFVITWTFALVFLAFACCSRALFSLLATDTGFKLSMQYPLFISCCHIFKRKLYFITNGATRKRKYEAIHELSSTTTEKQLNINDFMELIPFSE